MRRRRTAPTPTSVGLTDDIAQLEQKRKAELEQRLKERDANLRTGYTELCGTYRAIDDFRGKLLGFLPVATGGGLLLLSGTDGATEGLSLPVGLFGVAVTLGLFAYEIYGIGKCHALITSGRALEGKLRLQHAGQFRERPREVLKEVNEPFAAAIIYPAVTAAWTYLAFRGMAGWMSPAFAAVVFIIGCALTMLYNHVLGEHAEAAASQAKASLD